MSRSNAEAFSPGLDPDADDEGEAEWRRGFSWQCIANALSARECSMQDCAASASSRAPSISKLQGSNPCSDPEPLDRPWLAEN